MGLWAVGLLQISEGLPHKLSLDIFLRASSNQVVTEGICGPSAR